MMHRILRYAVVVCIVILMCGFIFENSLYGQDKPGNIAPCDIRVLKGEILQVDVDNSRVSVQEIPDYPEINSPVFKEMDFTVTPDTKISQGSESMSLDDLEASQYVTVSYYYDNTGTVVTLSIEADM
ncbi:MAG: hypothetical protein ABH885_06475 [Candidatus Omnitrophota bacterium]